MIRLFLYSFLLLIGIAEAEETVCLVSYAHGDEVHFLNQEELVSSAEGKGITQICSYHFEDLSPLFRKECEAILRKRRGAGYWLWKPWIILHEMEKQPDGAIIMYVDSGSLIKNPLHPLIGLVKKQGFVCYVNSHQNLPYIKRDCYILMDCDKPEYYHAMQLQASDLFFLNNEENRKFVSKWLDFCKDTRILTDRKSELGKEFPEFKDHRHDQAVLSLLFQKSRLPGKVLPRKEKSRYFHHHRRRNLDEVLGSNQGL